MRRLFALVLTLFLLPAISLADDYVPYQVYTFAGTLPERLKGVMSAYVADESQIRSGAAIQHHASEYSTEQVYRSAYSALMLLDEDTGPRLLAAAWVDGLPLQVNDFSHLLRKGQPPEIRIHQPKPSSIPLFSVDYNGQNGPTSDLMMFFSNRLWQLRGHIDEAAGVSITTGLGSVTVIDAHGRTVFVTGDSFWMDYMDDISAFPTTRADAEALAQAAASAAEANTAAGWAYAQGAHLRKSPTSSAASLGKYNSDTPVFLTGAQKQGKQFPWLQVCIGSTLGWMSSNYISAESSKYFPVPMGRTTDGCPLYAAAQDKQPVAQLTPGTTFHILTEYKGMYHICIPRDAISWQVDPDGLYGYIPMKGVVTGASISALDAFEAAR